MNWKPALVKLQIEADRRLIGDRIARLRHQLDEVRHTRGLHREARRRVPFPVVALVGYTTPGNQLDESGAGEGIRTLDPNLGKVVLYP